MRFDSGKLVILTILAAGTAAAGFAWWFQYHQGRRALAYWGAEGAWLIRRAPQVELWRLSAASLSPAAEQGSLEGVVGRAVLERQDISHARGLAHARQALISDASFQWGSPASSGLSWRYALRFQDGPRAMMIVFDLEQGHARALHRSEPLKMGAKLTNGLRTFFAEQRSQAGPVVP